MSSPSHVAIRPITGRGELVDYIASGDKPKSDWRIGTEHEKFGFRLDDLRPPTYEGERGIEALLRRPDALRLGAGRRARQASSRCTRDGASVTLEPAGQFELSGAPLENHPPDLQRSRQPPEAR